MTERKSRFNLEALGVVYFFLFVLAVWFGTARGTFRFPPSGPGLGRRHLLDLSIAVFSGAAVAGATDLAARRLRSFRALARFFRDLLGPLGGQEIFLIASFSALAEEFFFRGWLQGEIGLVPTSLLFGLLHVGPDRRFLPWTLFAVALGFLLGGLYAWRGNLLIPVVVHFAVNFLNLRRLQATDDQGAGSS